MGATTSSTTTAPNSGGAHFLKMAIITLFILCIPLFCILKYKKWYSEKQKESVQIETKKSKVSHEEVDITAGGEITYILEPGEIIYLTDISVNRGSWSSKGYSPLFTNVHTGHTFRTTDTFAWDPGKPSSKWKIENTGEMTISTTYKK